MSSGRNGTLDCLNASSQRLTLMVYVITKEFITYSRPAIAVHLKLFFNMDIHHGFVPDSFGNGVIIPLTKDRQRDNLAAFPPRPLPPGPLPPRLFSK